MATEALLATPAVLTAAPAGRDRETRPLAPPATDTSITQLGRSGVRRVMRGEDAAADSPPPSSFSSPLGCKGSDVRSSHGRGIVHRQGDVGCYRAAHGSDRSSSGSR